MVHFLAAKVRADWNLGYEKLMGGIQVVTPAAGASGEVERRRGGDPQSCRFAKGYHR